MIGITYRELPASEWAEKIAHLPPYAEGLPSSDAARILVAETEDGTVIGCAQLCLVPHLEPWYIDPAYQKGRLGWELWGAAQLLLADAKVPGVFCRASEPAVAGYLERLGFTYLPGDLFQYDARHLLAPTT